MEPLKKRKLSGSAVVKCIIGQPKSIGSVGKCELCHREEAVFERNLCFGIATEVPLEKADRSTLRVCEDCSGMLDELDSFRKQAFCSFKYLVNTSVASGQPRICRFCFVSDDGLEDMFDGQGRPTDVKLLDQMRDWLEIVLDPMDSVTKLCRPCIRSVKALAVLGVGPSMDIVYQQKEPTPSGSSKPKLNRKCWRGKQDEIDQNLLQLLQAPHEARNFTVLTAETEPHIKVVFEKYLFRSVKRFPGTSGPTVWKCVYNRLRQCKAEIEINPAGTGATLKSRHNHAEGSEELLEFPQGKGRIVVNGAEESFWLTHGATGKSPYTRTLFLGGHRFYLMSLGRKGTGSKWFCNRSWDTGCRVLLNVIGLFEAIQMCRNGHTHEPYPEAKNKRYLKECGVSLDVEDCGTDSPQEQKIVASPAEPEPAQNFTMSLTADQKVQITLNGSDFQWRDEAAGWCCVWSEIRRCPVQIRLSPNGKVATLVNPTSAHNHSDEAIAIFWQKLGKSRIFDEHENCEFNYKLSSCQEKHRPNRSIDYQGYRYRLATITDSGDSDWKCDRCEATVRVMGLFWIIDCRCLHSHGPLTWEELDFEEDLLPYKSTELTASVPQSPSALLKLLSIDEPERNFQLHHRGDQMKILQDGFEYYYICSKPTYSLWKCFYSAIRGCGATLHVDNLGRIGTPSNFTQHNHAIELWDLFYHRLGEGSIRDESTRVPSPFFFLLKPDFLRPLPYIVYQGHLFTMIFITERGERSKWRCVTEDCAVTANVTGLFEAIGVDGLPHCDGPLSEEEKRDWIGRFGTPDEF